MQTKVNPTRMELNNLKKRIKVAKRGHKLLKDKQDELVKRYIDLVRENDRLRTEVEKDLQQTFANFIIAKAMTSESVLSESIMYPVVQGSLEITTKNIMSVAVPMFRFVTSGGNSDSAAELYPYGFAETSGDLDRAIELLQALMPKLMRLAEVEKACQIIAKDIEKTRRRVNALEYIMIPDMEDNIKYITMKLDENERGNITRLMKIKDIVM